MKINVSLKLNYIEVDGVKRSRLNCCGKPIHPSDCGIINFWRWFGDSIVVKARKPLIVYHGANESFDRFNSFVNWFSYTHVCANLYAEANHYEKGHGGNMIVAYVRALRPFNGDLLDDMVTPMKFVDNVVDQAKTNYSAIPKEEVTAIKAVLKSCLVPGYGPKFRQYDYWFHNEYTFGLEGQRVIKKLFQLGNFDSISFTEGKHRTIGVFDGNQVKSAIGNNGNFSKRNKSIVANEN